MSEAKRIRLDVAADASAYSADAVAMEPRANAVVVESPDPSPQLLELVQDCTCPVCKDIYTEPAALVTCGHTFCRRCYERFCRKCSALSGGGFGLHLTSARRQVACPVCRMRFQPGPEAARPDPQLDCLVRALRVVSADCCAAVPGCWRRRAVHCLGCNTAACQFHHAASLDRLRREASAAAAAALAFSSNEAAGGEQLRRLAELERRLPQMRRRLRVRLSARLDEYEARLAAASERVRQAAEESSDGRMRLAELAGRLESAVAEVGGSGSDDCDGYAGVLALKSRLTADLGEARTRHPAIRIDEPCGLEDLERGLDGCLDGLAVRLCTLPYESVARAAPAVATSAVTAATAGLAMPGGNGTSMPFPPLPPLPPLLSGGSHRLPPLLPPPPARLSPSARRRTRPCRPFGLRLLSNTDGLRLLDGRLVLARTLPSASSSSSTSSSSTATDAVRGSQPLPESGVLLVNYRGCPASRLHLFETASGQLTRIGFLQLQLSPTPLLGDRAGGGGFSGVRRQPAPGRIAVCNRRQLLFATDAIASVVMVFAPTGRMVATFGSFGGSDTCACCQGVQAPSSDSPEADGPYFDRPLGLCSDGSVLYVVDSGNRRVQMFDLDAPGYSRHTGCLRHPDFTGLHSVLACQSWGTEANMAWVGGNVVVSDREADKIYLFDSRTRRCIRSQASGGSPVDLCSDRHGNILVSLSGGRLVRVFDPQLTQCLYTFRLDGGGKSVGLSAAQPHASRLMQRPPTVDYDEDEDGHDEEDDEDELMDVYQYQSSGNRRRTGHTASSLFSASSSDSSDSSSPDFLESAALGFADPTPPDSLLAMGEFFLAGGGGGGGGIGGNPGADCLHGIAVDPGGRRLYAADAQLQCLLAYQL